MLASTHLFDYQVDSVRMLIEQEERGEMYGLRGHCVLTDPKGSGKTFVILALISARPLPKNKDGAIAYVYDNARDNVPYLSIRATLPNQIVRPTCIIAPAYVYSHWIDIIRSHTVFRLHTIATKKDARAFCKMALSGEANDYDIVLVRYSEFVVSRTDKNKYVDVCHMINCETMPMMWARVVYDDVYDIQHATQLRAISSIYVNDASAPRMEMIANQSMRASLCDLTSRLASVQHIYAAHGRLWATCGHDMHTVLQDAHIPNITLISAIICLHDHADERTCKRKMIVDTHDSHHFDIGPIVCQPSDALSHIIGDTRLNMYRASQECVAGRSSIFARERTHYREDQPIDEHAPTSGTREHDASALGREIIKQCDLLVARVSENIARDECVICYSRLSESDAIAVAKCCGTCTCASCCLSTLSVTQEGANIRMNGQCALCRADISTRDIVFIPYTRLNLIEDLAQSALDSRVEKERDHIETKIDYIIELARSGCIPSTSLGVDARVYDEEDIPAFIEHGHSCDRAREVLPTPRADPIILVYPCDSKILNRARYAARAESMRECGITTQSDMRYCRNAILISKDRDISPYADTCIMSASWITDIVVMDKLSSSIISEITRIAQCIGRTQELRVHALEYGNGM